MLESKFQAQLIVKLKKLFPGCMVMKNDSAYQQGIPDLTVVYRKRWAMLEVKAKADARTQTNQEYFVEQLNDMSYAAFIYPENEEEILHELQLALKPDRAARVSKR